MRPVLCLSARSTASLQAPRKRNIHLYIRGLEVPHVYIWLVSSYNPRLSLCSPPLSTTFIVIAKLSNHQFQAQKRRDSSAPKVNTSSPRNDNASTKYLVNNRGGIYRGGIPVRPWDQCISRKPQPQWHYPRIPCQRICFYSQSHQSKPFICYEYGREASLSAGQIPLSRAPTMLHRLLRVREVQVLVRSS